ncbi:MAG: hypothetical protein V2J55_21455 [Candidatus Competibacteraceae bacterium]|jgi:hypothetical protein|nr:hypothetical protein [Candidatus Competibacteraceae bacterium]
MPKDKRDVEAGLLNKGFQKQPGGDHNYFVYIALDGKKSLAKTKTSHGRGFDIGDSLLGMIARQCALTRAQFLKLIECPLSREEYETVLRDFGKL